MCTCTLYVYKLLCITVCHNKFPLYYAINCCSLFDVYKELSCTRNCSFSQPVSLVHMITKCTLDSEWKFTNTSGCGFKPATEIVAWVTSPKLYYVAQWAFKQVLLLCKGHNLVTINSNIIYIILRPAWAFTPQPRECLELWLTNGKWCRCTTCMLNQHMQLYAAIERSYLLTMVMNAGV